MRAPPGILLPALLPTGDWPHRPLLRARVLLSDVSSGLLPVGEKTWNVQPSRDIADPHCFPPTGGGIPDGFLDPQARPQPQPSCGWDDAAWRHRALPGPGSHWNPIPQCPQYKVVVIATAKMCILGVCLLPLCREGWRGWGEFLNTVPPSSLSPCWPQPHQHLHPWRVQGHM